MRKRNSPAAAFSVAGLVALASWLGFLFVYTIVLDGMTSAARLFPYMLMGAVLAGVPLVIAVLAVAWPLSALLRRTLGLSLPLAVVAGSACALLAGQLVVAALGQPEARFVPAPVMVLTGTMAGWAWWRAWTSPAPSEPSHRGAV